MLLAADQKNTTSRRAFLFIMICNDIALVKKMTLKNLGDAIVSFVRPQESYAKKEQHF